jgi:hypothetical protein
MIQIAQNIIGFITAFIPLLLAITAFLNNRRDKTTGPLDVPAIKILEIVRQPINEDDWRKISNKYAKRSTILLFIFFIIIIVYYFLLTRLNLILSFILGIIFAFSMIVYLIVSSRNPLSKIFDSENGRYFASDEVKIKIKSDSDYLFNKCVEGLKSMEFFIVEAREDKGLIEGIKLFYFNSSLIMRITITKSSESENTYLIVPKCHELKVQDFRKNISRLGFILFYNGPSNILATTKYINRFIDKLIIKSNDLSKKTS